MTSSTNETTDFERHAERLSNLSITSLDGVTKTLLEKLCESYRDCKSQLDFIENSHNVELFEDSHNQLRLMCLIYASFVVNDEALFETNLAKLKEQLAKMVDNIMFNESNFIVRNVVLQTSHYNNDEGIRQFGENCKGILDDIEMFRRLVWGY